MLCRWINKQPGYKSFEINGVTNFLGLRFYTLTLITCREMQLRFLKVELLTNAFNE